MSIQATPSLDDRRGASLGLHHMAPHRVDLGDHRHPESGIRSDRGNGRSKTGTPPPTTNTSQEEISMGLSGRSGQIGVRTPELARDLLHTKERKAPADRFHG